MQSKIPHNREISNGRYRNLKVGALLVGGYSAQAKINNGWRIRCSGKYHTTERSQMAVIGPNGRSSSGRGIFRTG